MVSKLVNPIRLDHFDVDLLNFLYTHMHTYTFSLMDSKGRGNVGRPLLFNGSFCDHLGIIIIPKLMIEWTKEKIKESQWNSKALYTIMRAITHDEYSWIQRYTTSKQDWDILEAMHESASTMKRSKISKLNKNFKLFIMEEDKTFENFYACFSNIDNDSYNLGRLLSEEKHIKNHY